MHIAHTVSLNSNQFKEFCYREALVDDFSFTFYFLHIYKKQTLEGSVN